MCRIRLMEKQSQRSESVPTFNIPPMLTNTTIHQCLHHVCSEPHEMQMVVPLQVRF